MPRPLIGVDLDGVIALEDYNAYLKAKAEGISALRNYYKTLKVNIVFVDELKKHSHHYRYVIVTARKNDIEDIKDITINWLIENNIEDLFWTIIFTGKSWKWPWLIYYGIKAHIDNDYSNLKWCPFIYRLGYNIFVRHNWFYDNIKTPWPEVHEISSAIAPAPSKYIFDFLNNIWYTK